MPRGAATLDHQIVARVIDLRLENLDIVDPAQPKGAEDLSENKMLYQRFTLS